MSLFNKLAKESSSFAGKPICFCIAVICILVWALSGPVFHFSDTWQLVINTSTTIITFLMVFIIQNTQNRDMMTLQLKLDELIISSHANNRMLGADDFDDKELAELAAQYKQASKEERQDE